MTRYVCSKMFTDMNVKFPYDNIVNCCKARSYQISDEEFDSLEKQGLNPLIHNAEYLRRKSSMIDDNELPSNACDACIKTEPNSLFRTWNTWHSRDFSNRDKYMYGDNFTNYEFVLSSACDLKCVYCAPKDSSSWAKEMGVPVNRGNEKWKHQIQTALLDHLRQKEYDPDVDYWFFFSGGEPTYNPETLPLIEQIIDIVPRPNIIISTNANTKPKVLDRYLDAVRRDRQIKWRFHCSIDDINERAEAIRYGLDWNQAISNMKILMQEPNVTVRVCPTVNLLSVPSMTDFVTYFYGLFQEYDHVNADMFDVNMVQEYNLSPWSMPEEYRSCLDEAIAFC